MGEKCRQRKRLCQIGLVKLRKKWIETTNYYHQSTDKYPPTLQTSCLIPPQLMTTLLSASMVGAGGRTRDNIVGCCYHSWYWHIPPLYQPTNTFTVYFRLLEIFWLSLSPSHLREPGNLSISVKVLLLDQTSENSTVALRTIIVIFSKQVVILKHSQPLYHSSSLHLRRSENILVKILLKLEEKINPVIFLFLS